MTWCSLGVTPIKVAHAKLSPECCTAHEPLTSLSAEVPPQQMKLVHDLPSRLVHSLMPLAPALLQRWLCGRLSWPTS